MQIRFFTVPALDPGPASEEVFAFFSTHRIIEITREFVANGPNSYWAICVTYTCGASSSLDAAPKRPPNNYREVLSAEPANRNWNDPGNRNDDLGFRLSRAQTWSGWTTPDPTAVPSSPLPCGRGECRGRRCASRASAPNAHRRPSLHEAHGGSA